MDGVRPQPGPYGMSIERAVRAAPGVLYRDWAQQFDRCFAAPGTVLMPAAVKVAFFFATRYQQ